MQNGPGAYIAQGWNGNVTISGVTTEFIVISLQPPTSYPTESVIDTRIQTLKSTYRIDPKKLFLTGLSHGGWCSLTYITGDPLGGPYTYANQIKAVVGVESVVPTDNSPYPGLFSNFALNNGRLLAFEQVNDFRDTQTYVNYMNSIVPNSAFFQSTNFGGGGHCCWNQFYGGQGVTPSTFNIGGISQNIYGWLVS